MAVEVEEFVALLARFEQVIGIIDQNVKLIGDQAVKIRQLEADSHNHRLKDVSDGA